MRIIKARGISDGIGKGEAIILKEPFGFYGNVDPKTGIIIEKGNPLEGVCIKDKVFIFPNGKGSTVGSYVIYGLKKNGVAPSAIINLETETIVATGVIVDERLESGDMDYYLAVDNKNKYRLVTIVPNLNLRDYWRREVGIVGKIVYDEDEQYPIILCEIIQVFDK